MTQPCHSLQRHETSEQKGHWIFYDFKKIKSKP